MLSPRGARGVERLNSTGTLIQTTTTEAPQRTYVLHRTGCSQEDDQLLRQGCEWSSSPGRKSWSDALGTGQLDEDSSSPLDGCHGSNDLHRLDLRSSASACDPGESGASTDAARHRSAKKKNDRIDAGKIADCLRCDFLPPECHMASTQIRDRRRTLRYTGICW
jgi:hypothetical protein